MLRGALRDESAEIKEAAHVDTDMASEMLCSTAIPTRAGVRTDRCVIPSGAKSVPSAAQEPLGPQAQDDEEQNKGDKVLQAGGDEACGEGLEEADDEATE